MAFDIDNILKEMAAAAISSLGTDAKNAATKASALLEAHRDVLQQISYSALSDELTEEELRQEIKDELLLFQSEMFASHVSDKAAIQKAAHAAGEILIEALTELLP